MIRCPGIGDAYQVAELGRAVRVVDQFVVLDWGGRSCLYRSWRLSYGIPSMELVAAEVLGRGDSAIVRILARGEKPMLREVAEANPLYVYAMDVNERGIVWRGIKVSSYAELIGRGVTSSILDIRPRSPAVVIADIPSDERYRRHVEELLALGETSYTELHSTMISHRCVLCGGEMRRIGRRVRCDRCGIELSRDVSATWNLARNILTRLGRASDAALLRELFLSLYPDV